MSAPAPTSHRAPGKKDKAAKKNFWSMEIGKKSAGDEKVEHPDFVPTLPRVDLLPASVRSRQSRRRVIRILLALLAVLVLAGLALWWLQGSRIDEAQANLDAALTQQQAVQQKVASLAPVKEMYTQIQGQKDLVDSTLASQPQATAVLQHLNEVAAQAGGADPLVFSSASVSYQGLPAAGGQLNVCADPNPFAKNITVGCMTFSGTASSREQISSFLTLMAADPMFVGPYVDNTTIATDPTGASGQVSFSGTSGVSVQGLVKTLTPEQIDAIINPPDPAADPNAAGSAS